MKKLKYFAAVVATLTILAACCLSVSARALLPREPRTGNIAPDATTPEITIPEITTPEMTTPEVTTPEATTPEVTTPEVTTPEVTTPEVTTTVPDTTVPSTTKAPDTTVPSTTKAPDTTTANDSENKTKTSPWGIIIALSAAAVIAIVTVMLLPKKNKR